jgi:WD repeat-containing protein 68
LALGSFIEEYNNKVEIVQLNDETQAFERIGDGTEGAGVFNHPYPTTKIMWAPETQTQDMLATTGDYLRLWGVNEDGTVKAKCLLNNVRNEWTEHCTCASTTLTHASCSTRRASSAPP